ncbi:MAG: AIR synthase family protein [Bacillota bacterium]|nr:AIR synthase family protein [Bacillota bacterium]
MKLGKLNTLELNHILRYSGAERPDVIQGAKVGEDCAILRIGDYDIAVTTDPITSASCNIGSLAFNVNCNDIASCGIRPAGLMVTILAPPSAQIEEIRVVMRDIDRSARENGIAVLGGHTEVTDSVNRIIVSITAFGYDKKESLVLSTIPELGDDIVVTKELCIEGSSIIVNDFLDEVSDVLNQDEIKELKNNINRISVIKDGEIGRASGVSSMHDITEGGVLGALCEITSNKNLGFRVYYDKMPISIPVFKICDKLGLDPLRLISSGSMLITTRDSEKLLSRLKESSINGTVIGKITEKKGILVKEGMEYNIFYNEKDELYKLFGGY